MQPPTSEQHLVTRWRSRCVVFILLLMSGLNGGAHAQAEMEVQVGVSGTYKIGCWTSAEIHASIAPETSCRALVKVLDADGNLATFLSETGVSDSAGTVHFTVPVIVNRMGSDWIIQLQQTGETESAAEILESMVLGADSLTALTQHQKWLLAVGNVQGIEPIVEFVDDLVVSSVAELKAVPAESQLLSGFDAIVCCVGNGQLESLGSLYDWVCVHGGHLVVTSDVPADQFVASPLPQQLQIQFNQSSQIRDLSRVELFTGEASRLRTNAPLTIPLITEFDGETLVGGLAGPLVVEMPRGLGTIVFNSLPLNNRAFQSWDALPQFYRILCQFPKLSTNSSERKSNLLTQTGLSDFKTQWDAALADFGITTPSVWIPLSLILATALIVGPVDYFLVRHLLRKPLLTWVTFPILAVLATVWGVSSPGIPQKDGVQLGASSAVMANRVTMIDYATDTHTVRVQDFTKLMLPQTGRYDVTVPHQWPAPFEVDQSFTATSAVPEATYRGYYRVSGTHLDQTTYQIAAAEGKLLAAPAYERSTILIQSVGYQGVDEAQKPQTDSIIETTLSGTSSLQLSGEIRHHLPMPITDWILAYDKLIYYVDEGSTLDELGPGTTLQFPDRNIKQRELSAYLTGTTKQLVKREKGVGEDLIIRQLDYDVFATDLEYIASLLTFHQMAGGSDYTHLTNLELTSWDMSEQLRLGRAILFGRIELPEGELAIRDEQISVGKREAFVRFVIPVNRRQTGIEKLPDYRKKNEEETEASGKQ